MSEKIDLAEWKRFAEAALKEANNDPMDWYDVDFLFDDCFRNYENAEFTAASSPARVLALIEALEVAREALNFSFRAGPPASSAGKALARIAELLGEERP